MTPTLKHTTYSQQNYSNYIKYYMLLNQEFSINGYMIDRSHSQNAKKKTAGKATATWMYGSAPQTGNYCAI